MASTAPKANPETSTDDAADLSFPKEFNHPSSDALLTSEVFMLLDHRRQQSEQKEEIDELSPVFIKTLDYTRRFNKFKNRETIRAVRTLFHGQNKIHKFELAQLSNLLPETAEEAKSLIPSLENKVSDDLLEELIKELIHKKTFQ
uniref:RPOL4c domain-containing protein n=1 Tax=Rhabditophanes sp. KR3021 TaxID=114890 RepID=A0AC35TY29_9BILA